MYYSTNVKRSSKTTILGLIHSETTDLMRKKVITALITVRGIPENRRSFRFNWGVFLQALNLCTNFNFMYMLLVNGTNDVHCFSKSK